MAAGEDAVGRLRRGSGLRFEQLKGRVFEALLIGATLVGIVSLLVLFGYIVFDAVGPLAASPRWYLLYFGTLVTPTAAFTLYARRRPAVRAANARAFAAVFGGVVLSLAVYAVSDALSPYDVFIYLVFGGGPSVSIAVYARKMNDNTFAGPAVPVSMVIGVAVAAGFYDVLRPIIGTVPRWITYIGITTVPVAVITGWFVAREWTTRRGLFTAGVVVAGGFAVAGGALVSGIDPSFWVVLFSGTVVPVAFVVGSTAATNPEGRIGMLGPFVVIGGGLLGAVVERQFGIAGLDSYLTPTLLLNSWDGLNAANAGVYPQIVGSIIIVAFMGIMAIPVGIGAAVYLEEYAPATGWRGRLASLLEINIANLAGVPSVVYGLLGLALFRNTLGFGTGIVVAASGTLGFLILPIVVVSAQEAIRSVPDSRRRASYGMGASRWQTLREVVLPEAVPGVLTGTILALGRAIGETAPLVIIAVATTTYSAPSGLFSSATALPLQIFASAGNAKPEFRTGVVAATAIVLLALMILMNAIAIVVRNRYQKDD